MLYDTVVLEAVLVDTGTLSKFYILNNVVKLC